MVLLKQRRENPRGTDGFDVRRGKDQDERIFGKSTFPDLVIEPWEGRGRVDRHP
jgi:hypothetical protein